MHQAPVSAVKVLNFSRYLLGPWNLCACPLRLGWSVVIVREDALLRFVKCIAQPKKQTQV